MMVSEDTGADNMAPSMVVMLESAPSLLDGIIDQTLLDPLISGDRLLGPDSPCARIEQQIVAGTRVSGRRSAR